MAIVNCFVSSPDEVGEISQLKFKTNIKGGKLKSELCSEAEAPGATTEWPDHMSCATATIATSEESLLLS